MEANEGTQWAGSRAQKSICALWSGRHAGAVSASGATGT